MRGALWSASSALGGAGTFVVFRSLDFSPAGGSHRLVDVSLLIAVLPVAVGAVYLLVLGLRWIALAVWPTSVGVVATSDALILRLGPFGIRRFDVARLDLKYAFELTGDEDDGGFESFLPEKEQMAMFLPRMLHPTYKERIDLLILKFAGGSESDVADALRPAFDRWRSKKG